MNLAPFPKYAFLDNNGKPLNGGLLFSYVVSTSTKIATYTDASGSTSNTNPIVLDFRGEASVWLDKSLTYKFTLSPPGDTDPPTKPIWTVDNITSAISLADLTQAIIGQILYPRTAAEITAGVTPSFYYYPPYDYRRYGAVADGTTDNTTLIVNTNAAFGASFSGVFYQAPNVLANFTTVTAAIVGARFVIRDESLINAHNSAGFRQKIVGWTDGGDATAVNDFSFRISSRHNATLILDNQGNDGSSSGDNGIAMTQYTRGELTIGQPDPRDIARTEFGKATALKWWWVLRRAAPWVARTWEYWAQGQVISAIGVYRRTATGYYISASTGTTGATEPNWLTGTSSDGGVNWTTVLPNIDSGVFAVDQWGQIATNTSTEDGTVAYLKADQYSPGNGQAFLKVAAAGVSQNAECRLIPTNAGGTEVAMPYERAQDGVGIRGLSSSGAVDFYRISDANYWQFLSGMAGAKADLAYSASMTPNANTANSFIIRITNGTAFTINAPSNPIDGRRIKFTLRNQSGGAAGAATWNATYKMSAWTNPANGNSRSIEFEYDSTVFNWIQINQTGVDVSN
jgi:hypothetical protein